MADRLGIACLVTIGGLDTCVRVCVWGGGGLVTFEDNKIFQPPSFRPPSFWRSVTVCFL